MKVNERRMKLIKSTVTCQMIRNPNSRLIEEHFIRSSRQRERKVLCVSVIDSKLLESEYFINPKEEIVVQRVLQEPKDDLC